MLSSRCSWLLIAVFFFQAEDGIRGLIVTGVQTCALPIYDRCGDPDRGIGRRHRDDQRAEAHAEHGDRQRSEERRVGKECRCRLGTCTLKKNKNKIMSASSCMIESIVTSDSVNVSIRCMSR